MVVRNNGECLREEQRTKGIVLDSTIETAGQCYCCVNGSERYNKHNRNDGHCA